VFTGGLSLPPFMYYFEDLSVQRILFKNFFKVRCGILGACWFPRFAGLVVLAVQLLMLCGVFVLLCRYPGFFLYVV